MTAAADDAPSSGYQRVLGDAYGDLPPVLARYFGPIPLGYVGVGEGTYDTVGSRYRLLAWPLLAWSARHDMLFPETGAQVPFLVESRPAADGLAGSRWFAFPGRLRVMRDTMRAGDGEIIERIGRRGGLEVRLRPAVADGRMVLRCRRLAWRVGGLRVPLPRVASVTVRESADPDGGGRQRVDVRLRMPLLGEVFRYSGSFAYRIVRDDDSGSGGSPALPTLSMWLTQNSPH